MTQEEERYEKKERERLSMQEAIHSYFLAAGEYGCAAYDIGNEIADAVFEATDKTVKVNPEDV